MRSLLLIFLLTLTACSSAPPDAHLGASPDLSPGPTGVCVCTPQLREHVVTLDAADFQVDDTEVTVEPVLDWPIGGRVAALWVDPLTVQQPGLVSSQLYLDVGVVGDPAAFASTVPLSTPTPTIRGYEGMGLWPSGAVPLTSPLTLRVYSDHMPLLGAVGHVDLHVVVAVPTAF